MSLAVPGILMHIVSLSPPDRGPMTKAQRRDDVTVLWNPHQLIGSLDLSRLCHTDGSKGTSGFQADRNLWEFRASNITPRR